MLQNYSHNNSTPTVPNDEFYDPKPEEIDIDNLQIPTLKHGGEAIIEKIKAKEKQLTEKITGGAFPNIISLKAELNKLQTVNKELLEEQMNLTNLRIQYIKRWHMFANWFNGSYGKTNRHSYMSFNGKKYYSKNDPLIISSIGNVSVSNITLLSSNESNFYIQTLPVNQKLADSYYSWKYQGYKITFQTRQKLIEVDFMIYLVNSVWLSELKIMMQPIIYISDSIRAQKEKIATYIEEQQSQTKDFSEYTVDFKNLDY